MLRAIVSVGQRGKLPHLLTARGLDHVILEQLKLHHSSRMMVRYFASGDDKMKGPTGVNQGGIIGNLHAPTNMTGAANCEHVACAQTAAMATSSKRDDNLGKSKNCDITSQMYATPSIRECGKIGNEEAYNKPPSLPKRDNTKIGSSNNFTDDALKQLQEVATNLPSKAQVEKYFFRVVAFAYDISFLTATWTMRFVNENVVRNPNVQHYWKRFHEKMEQAKKD